MAVPLGCAPQGADRYLPRGGGNGAGALCLLMVKGQGKLQGAGHRITQNSLKPRVCPVLSWWNTFPFSWNSFSFTSIVFHIHPAPHSPGGPLSTAAFVVSRGSPSSPAMGSSCSKVFGHTESSTWASNSSSGVHPCWFLIGRGQNETPSWLGRPGLESIRRVGLGESWESWSFLTAETAGSGGCESWRWTSGENAALCFTKLMRGGAGQLQVLYLHCVWGCIGPRGVPMLDLIQSKELWRFTSLWGNVNILSGYSPTAWSLFLEESSHTLCHLDEKQQPNRTQHERVLGKSHASAPSHCRNGNQLEPQGWFPPLEADKTPPRL